MPMPLINEIGNKYGSLTVIELTKDKNGRTAWLCQCDCGNTKIARGSDLRKNKITHCSKSCPCKTSSTFIDETGNVYGFLTVLNKAFKDSNNNVLWHCKCECGNEVDVLGNSLRRNLTTSCGCKKNLINAEKHSKDLTGMTFGYLTPIEIVKYGEGSSQGNIWRCKCSCGCGREDVLVSTHNLSSKQTQSCGRLRRSHGEIEIEKVLKRKNISFKQEFSFEDLSGDLNLLKFDFCIFKNNKIFCLIEFDGLQHFEPIEYFGGQKRFEQQIKYDNLKNNYCKDKNILLLRIKYTDEENIEQIIIDFLERNNF